VITMDVGVLVAVLSAFASVVVVAGALAGFYAALRREVRHIVDDAVGASEARTNARFDSLEGQVVELRAAHVRTDERLSSLAEGLRPLAEQAQRTS